MGIALAHIVRQGQVLQAERSDAILALRPDDAVRAQCMGQSHDVQQIPARIAVAPFALVGIVEIAEQPVADELVVEAQRVVAQRAGLRACHFLGDAGERGGFVDAIPPGLLRRDAGDQGRGGRGQQIVRGLDEETDGFLDRVQFRIGTLGGELGDAGPARVGAEGFQIVEQETGAHRDSASRGESRRITSASTCAQST